MVEEDFASLSRRARISSMIDEIRQREKSLKALGGLQREFHD